MSVPIERPVSAQLATARLILGQFEEQLREWRRMGVKRRQRTVRGRDLGQRLDGLKAGHAKWTQRVAELEDRLAVESSEDHG
ncbi:hypothetical protein [Microbacterium paludicola]|uniref:hypothetical protein n=1 Tax=Microbacterium paludicola TaxID=300019 RepID=UPI0011A20860|nr:hypothetical protein [Microbacterium paludicola]